jgi:hypothetical protein
MAAVLLGASLALPATAAAQDGFLFAPPEGSFTVRVGPMLYTARGDVFDALRRDLTLERSDFSGPAAGAEMAMVVLSRLDVALGVGYTRSSARSEFLEWVDQDERPIEQTTSMESVPLTLTLRYLLLSRGRSISGNAWLPAATTPYVGVGGGAAWYRLRQDGDFVDFRDNRIFTDVVETSGWHGIVHALAGVDYWIQPRVGLNAEARYTHGRARPGEGFHTFDRLDVGGLQATIGLSVRW